MLSAAMFAGVGEARRGSLDCDLDRDLDLSLDLSDGGIYHRATLGTMFKDLKIEPKWLRHISIYCCAPVHMHAHKKVVQIV